MASPISWLSATGGGGGGSAPPPKKRLFPPKIFKKTTERTIETIAYCFKNNGLLSFAPQIFSGRRPVSKREIPYKMPNQRMSFKEARPNLVYLLRPLSDKFSSVRFLNFRFVPEWKDSPSQRCEP